MSTNSRHTTDLLPDRHSSDDRVSLRSESSGPQAEQPDLCPLCQHSVSATTEQCASCGGDLRPLLRAVEVAYKHYNEAVRAARARRWADAMQSLAVTLALVPDDTDALVLLGKVHYWQGRRKQAKDTFQRALLTEPRHALASQALAILTARSDRRPPNRAASKRRS